MPSKFANKAAVIIALIMISFSLFISCKKEISENPKPTIFSDLNVILHGGEIALALLSLGKIKIILLTWIHGFLVLRRTIITSSNVQRMH